MLRRRLKAGIASAFCRSGVDRCIDVLITSARTPVIVGYHRVIDDVRALAGGAIPAMLISVVMLERQLDWIGRRFRVVSLDELAQRLERGEEAGGPLAAITFDDGYRDVYDHALPLLERKGMPAAVFVTTGLIGTREVQLHDRLYLALVRAFRTWRSAPHDLARLLRALEIPWPGARVVRAARSPLRAMRALFTTLPQAELHRVIDRLEAEVGVEEGAFEAHRLLSWDMVRDLHRAGIVIGSHGYKAWERMLLGSGISFLIGFQAFINIGVVTSALPNKGLALPFISYGGSNLLIMLTCVGILLSIARRSRAPETSPPAPP